MMYFEDFEVGQRIVIASRTVTHDEIVHFAGQFDPQPFHVDDAAAEASIFGSVIASGWHTCSMMMRLVVDAVLGGSSSLGSPGVDKVRWILPVRPGDTLTVTYVTTAVKGSSSRPDRGVVWSAWEARNQKDELVCVIEGMGMFGRRPAGGGDA